MVLIESDWNLKCDRGEYRITAGEVLIESDWNLKKVPTAAAGTNTTY